MKKIYYSITAFLIFFALMISSSTFNFKISAESISETDDIISGGIYYIRNVNSERYFDVADALTVDGTNVQQYAYNPNAK